MNHSKIIKGVQRSRMPIRCEIFHFYFRIAWINDQLNKIDMGFLVTILDFPLMIYMGQLRIYSILRYVIMVHTSVSLFFSLISKMGSSKDNPFRCNFQRPLSKRSMLQIIGDKSKTKIENPRGIRVNRHFTQPYLLFTKEKQPKDDLTFGEGNQRKFQRKGKKYKKG